MISFGPLFFLLLGYHTLFSMMNTCLCHHIILEIMVLTQFYWQLCPKAIKTSWSYLFLWEIQMDPYFFFHMFFIVLLDLKCEYTPYAILIIFYWPQNQDNNDHMAYWLSNTSTLLFLLQKSLTSTGAAGAAPRRKPPPTSLFGRMAMVLGHFDFSLFF